MTRCGHTSRSGKRQQQEAIQRRARQRSEKMSSLQVSSSSYSRVILISPLRIKLGRSAAHARCSGASVFSACETPRLTARAARASARAHCSIARQARLARARGRAQASGRAGPLGNTIARAVRLHGAASTGRSRAISRILLTRIGLAPSTAAVLSGAELALQEHGAEQAVSTAWSALFLQASLNVWATAQEAPPFATIAITPLTYPPVA